MNIYTAVIPAELDGDGENELHLPAGNGREEEEGGVRQSEIQNVVRLKIDAGHKDGDDLSSKTGH